MVPVLHDEARPMFQDRQPSTRGTAIPVTGPISETVWLKPPTTRNGRLADVVKHLAYVSGRKLPIQRVFLIDLVRSAGPCRYGTSVHAVPGCDQVANTGLYPVKH